MELQKSMLVNITVAKDALAFGDNNSSLYEAIITQFRNCVSKKIDRLTDYLWRNNSPLYEQIMQKWTDLSATLELHHSFLYPEMLNHLVLDRDPETTGMYMMRSLDAELAKRDKVFDIDQYDYVWTMNGDFLLQYNKQSKSFEAFESFRLNDMPLDFFSSSCIKVTAHELQEPAGSVIDEYDYREAFNIYERIYESLEPLTGKKGAGDLNDLIYKFTNVIVLKRQNYQSGNRHFFSSSDGYYIGRTVLGNVELVSPEILVDSIVHEAIHALLYMIDEKFQWQPSPEESDKIGNKILSPWSGNKLSIRNYLQAIFVWYGLFNLWKFALKEQVYDPGFAKRRVDLIRNGFLQVEINKFGKEIGYDLDETLIETVLAIKEYVIKN